MNRTIIVATAVVALAAATAACGGGGGSSSTAALAPNRAGTAALNGTAVLAIPNRATTSAGSRSAQYVSPSVSSVGMVVNGGAAAFSNVAAGSTLCTQSTSGRTCTIPLSAPPGSDTFVVTLYDGASGSGTNLGSSTIVQTVAAGAPFTLAFTVNGIVASIVITVPAIDAGPTSVPVAVAAKDADGNTIIGSAAYATPITLTDSDTTGTLKLSTTTVTAPTTAVSLAYTGGAVPSGVQIGATSTGIASSAITAASVTPLNYFPFGITNTYAYASSDADTSYVGGAAQPSSAPYLDSGSYQTAISSGATLNGVSGLEEIAVGDTAPFTHTTTYGELQNGAFVDVGISRAQSVTEPPAISLGPPYGCSGVVYTDTETTTNSPPLIYAVLPFSATTTNTATTTTVSGTDTTAPGNTAGCTTLPPAAFTDTISATTGVDGSYQETDSYSDGSRVTFQSNADGSGKVAFSAGTALETGATTWENSMSPSWTAASATVSAPSGGNILISASQTIAGSTLTSSVSVPAADLYPAGVPTALLTSTSTSGAAVSALPSSCAVTGSYPGPFVPVTNVLSTWDPVFGYAQTQTTTDYLAPAVGVVCELTTEVEQANAFGSLTPLQATADGTPFPVSEFNTADIYTYTETDSLTSTAAGAASLSLVRSSPATARGRFGKRLGLMGHLRL